MSDGTTQFARDIIVKLVVIGLVIVLFYVLLLRPILIKIGIIKSADDKKRENEEKQLGTSPDSPFSPSYYKGRSGALLITRATAQKLADEIADSYGWFDDDEERIYGALRQLKAKTQLSFLSEVYYQRHHQDMYQKMRDKLDDSELDVIHGIVGNYV